MWPTTNEIPEYGVLHGVKVLHATMAQAAPFGVSFLADYGADVIWVENALLPDVRRSLSNRCVESDSRNQRNIALNIPSEEGRKIFLELIKDADIFIECSKGGQYAKWGLSDEVLWEVNPRLVITHVSGFGQVGDPSYVSRPSFDSIAQAYSSYMDANRNPVTAPYPVGPFVGDFMTGVYVAMSSLAALTKARATGVGESVDIAQFECLAKAQQYQATWLTDHETREHAGDPSPMAAYATCMCSDGAYIQVQATSAKGVKAACPIIGVEYGTEDIPEGVAILYLGTPGGDKFRKALEDWCAQMPSDEAVKILLESNVPCSKVNTMEDLEHDPHALARNLFDEWTSFKGDTIRSVRAVPVFKKNPNRVWRAAPWLGMDNEDILGQLGYSEEQIADLYEQKVIAHDENGDLVYPWNKK